MDNTNSNNIPADMLAALNADYADSLAAFVLAQQTMDLELEQTAIAKYKSLCETCHTLNISLDTVVL